MQMLFFKVHPACHSIVNGTDVTEVDVYSQWRALQKSTLNS